MSNKFTLLTFLSLCIIGSSGCVIKVGGAEQEGNVSSIFGPLEVSEGKTVKDVSSVNGGVELGDHVQAQRIESVNGTILVGDFVSVYSIHTVNGHIKAGHNLRVSQDIRTVNGSVNIKSDSLVSRDIETINGDITLDDVTVGGNIETRSGIVSLSNHTQVTGDIVFHTQNKDAWNWAGEQNIPQLTIDIGSTVQGRIILEREVKLNFVAPELQARVIRRYQALQ
ncbi:MAG: DUF4097 and DUF4098 domain-containing protein YvlB [Paraglaciecola sp.]|jgi:DUF4097 and DUF4098 domain-containing protein YvlB